MLAMRLFFWGADWPIVVPTGQLPRATRFRMGYRVNRVIRFLIIFLGT